MPLTTTMVRRGWVLALPLALLVLGVSLSAEGVDVGEGASIFGAQCAACHQATGEGLPGVFPPLADHVHELIAAEGGRPYPILVVLYGLQGPITVNGNAYDSLMPPFGHLTDEEISDVLNYVMTAWGDAARLEEEFEPYAPAEVAAERDRALNAMEVHEFRSTLALD